MSSDTQLVAVQSQWHWDTDLLALVFSNKVKSNLVPSILTYMSTSHCKRFVLMFQKFPANLNASRFHPSGIKADMPLDLKMVQEMKYGVLHLILSIVFARWCSICCAKIAATFVVTTWMYCHWSSFVSIIIIYIKTSLSPDWWQISNIVLNEWTQLLTLFKYKAIS